MGVRNFKPPFPFKRERWFKICTIIFSVINDLLFSQKGND